MPRVQQDGEDDAVRAVPGARRRPAEVQSRQRMVIEFDPRSFLRVAGIAVLMVAALFLGLWLFAVVRHFAFLLLLAWMFAIALEPGIARLVERGRRRGLAAALVGGGAVLVVSVLGVVFGRLFFDSASGLVGAAPGVVTSAVTRVNSLFHTKIDPDHLSAALNLSGDQVRSLVSSLSGGVLGVVGSLAAVGFDMITVLVFGFYFAADGPRFLRSVASWLPPRGQRAFIGVSDIVIAKTGGYVASKIVLAAASAAAHAALFWAIGVPFWLPFALFVGVTAQFIPIAGTYLGVALPVLATVFVTPWKALVIVLFALVYQQIETYVLTPRVSKKTMDVNPAIALAAVFVGAAIWGPLGAVIGIPLVAAAVSIADTYRHRYDLIPELAGGHGDVLVTTADTAGPRA